MPDNTNSLYWFWAANIALRHIDEPEHYAVIRQWLERIHATIPPVMPLS